MNDKTGPLTVTGTRISNDNCAWDLLEHPRKSRSTFLSGAPKYEARARVVGTDKIVLLQSIDAATVLAYMMANGLCGEIL